MVLFPPSLSALSEGVQYLPPTDYRVDMSAASRPSLEFPGRKVPRFPGLFLFPGLDPSFCTVLLIGLQDSPARRELWRVSSPPKALKPAKVNREGGDSGLGGPGLALTAPKPNSFFVRVSKAQGGAWPGQEGKCAQAGPLGIVAQGKCPIGRCVRLAPRRLSPL